MHVVTVLVDTSWLHSLWEMFLLFVKFKFFWKNGVHLPYHHPSFTTIVQPPPFEFYSKKKLVPPPFKKEDSNYDFYMRYYSYRQ